MACGQQDPGAPDGGDASLADGSDGSVIAFPDGSGIDSYVGWCEAGPPQWVAIDPINQCDSYLWVPCGLPEGDYVTDAGTFNRCDQVCKGFNAYDCEYADAATAYWAAAYVDASFDVGAPDAWPDGAVFIACGCYNGGRRPAGLRPFRSHGRSPLADYFSRMAHLEAASVPAFERMLAELRALGAPRALLAKVQRAIEEEQRHARVIGRLARRYGGATQPARVRRFRPRSIEAMAHENAVEGCVRETYGALVATWQARHAKDETVRRVMERIAIDETRHAELSAHVDEFLSERLDGAARRRVARARAREIEGLHAAVTEPHADLVRHAGLPTAEHSRRLLAALRSSVWSGASDASA